MSVHPIGTAAEAAREPPPFGYAAGIPIEPFQRKPRSRCSKHFIGTAVSVFIAAPILIWVLTILVRMVVQSGKEPVCDRLLRSDPTNEAFFAIVLITGFIILCAVIAFFLKDWYATVALWMVLLVSVSLLLGFPNVEDKTSLGIFHDRPVVAVVGEESSEYWRKTMRSCVCETEDCENYVYRNYMVSFYNLDDRDRGKNGRGFDYSGYTMISSTEYEAKRPGQPDQDWNGTYAKTSPVSDGPYHEVCYSKSAGDEGIKTLCYSCYACEENRLRGKLRGRWHNGNKLFIMTLLFITTNLIVFLAESWARYMDT